MKIVFNVLMILFVGQVYSQTINVVGKVMGVEVSGKDGSYHFSVKVSSPDKGCDQYANWWEVINLKGDLIYRRILAHSHVQEQPFTRSGGPVPVNKNDTVIVRVHMHPGGYGAGKIGMKGTVSTGFNRILLEPGFATDTGTTGPQPQGCRF